MPGSLISRFVPGCSHICPHVPIFPMFVFSLNRNKFQCSNECSSFDVTTLGKCGRKIPQLPAESFAGKLTFQLFQLDLQWCFCANNVGTSWGKRLQVQNDRPLWSGTVAFCWSSWSSRALELPLELPWTSWSSESLLGSGALGRVGSCSKRTCGSTKCPSSIDSASSQSPPFLGRSRLLIPFLPAIYQLFWCLPGVQGFDPSPHW